MTSKNELENYRPVYVSFDVAPDGSVMPETINTTPITSKEEITKFFAKNKITAINQAVTVPRHMDIYEKKTLREEYSDILENILPKVEKEYMSTLNELTEAKKNEKEALERLNAKLHEVKKISQEVKRGVVDMKLDDVYTFRIPFKGRYYFYTWMELYLRLCKIADIPEHEKNELWNSMATNEEFFNPKESNPEYKIELIQDMQDERNPLDYFEINKDLPDLSDDPDNFLNQIE